MHEQAVGIDLYLPGNEYRGIFCSPIIRREGQKLLAEPGSKTLLPVVEGQFERLQASLPLSRQQGIAVFGPRLLKVLRTEINGATLALNDLLLLAVDSGRLQDNPDWLCLPMSSEEFKRASRILSQLAIEEFDRASANKDLKKMQLTLKVFGADANLDYGMRVTRRIYCHQLEKGNDTEQIKLAAERLEISEDVVTRLVAAYELTLDKEAAS